MRRIVFTIFTLAILMASTAFASNSFYDQVDYKGAFGATNWADGWTALYHYGIIADPETPQNDVTVTDNDIQPGQTVYWTADNVYHLNGRVFVDDGAVLHIQAGTIIKGMPGSGENASALIVARGGKIYAEGTPQRPIIFTAESDDVNNPADISYDTKGLWGGVIILGKARINRPEGEFNIEGIPSTEPRGLYGGTDDDDNSGVFRYVSIRHGGAEIGEGNEINGLTLGGVGRGTTIDHVEVFANKDDGFEFFGGTVNVKNLIVAFCGDDGIDLDEGYRGKMQFIFVIQHPDFGNRCGEHDGAPKSAVTTEPKAYAQIYNATYLGSGMNSNNPDQDELLKLRENWGGIYANCIFGDYNGYGVDVSDKYSPNDAKDRLLAGEISFKNDIWFNFANRSLSDSIGKQSWIQAALQDPANGNSDSDPQLMGISRTQDGGLDPRPAFKGPAYQNLAPIPKDDFFEQVDYKGAFGATNWADGWTALYHYGIIADPVTPKNDVTVTDDDIQPGQTVFWTADNVYHLNGRVFVDDGAVLHIQAGTIIKGMPGSGENASALIVARGGRIYAEGTGQRPIIFTAESDDVNNPADISYDTKGLWGGVILLGKAKINRPEGEFNIEGIPSTEARGLYGGTDDDDNSGVFRYVSIRHGGAEIGEGNEINGLTLGGVGRGTTIDHVEVFANKDDGFEWFGGTVNVKNMIAAFCGDDGFDMDEGYRGKLQFLFVIQHPNFGNRCGEHDGAPKSAVTTEPKAYPVVYNATYLGSGQHADNPDQDELFKLRENFGGEYNNSIFGDYNGYGVDVSSKYSPNDSKDRLAAGELKLRNNLWFKLANYTLADSVGKEDYIQAYLQDPSHGNTFEDPHLMGISRVQDAGLDPRPAFNGPAYKNVLGYPTQIISRGYSHRIPESFALKQNYPNPFNPVTTIRFELTRASHVELTVYDLLGRKVATLINSAKPAGSYSVTWQPENLSSGYYIYVLRTGNRMLSKRMLLLK